MKTHYRHLSSEERAVIMIKVRQGKSCRAIARLLDRSPSTISRELARNSATASTPEKQPSRYDASAAALAYRKRRQRCRRRRKLIEGSTLYRLVYHRLVHLRSEEHTSELQSRFD